MKYKNINSAIHNFGHSFFSLINYIEDSYIIDELGKIHKKGYDIKIDWLNIEFEPKQMLNSKIEKSIIYYANILENFLLKQDVLLQKITTLYFVWNSEENDKYMKATDDRGKSYKIKIANTL